MRAGVYLCLACALVAYVKTSAKSISYRRASAAEANDSYTSYFQHAPYGPNTYNFGYELHDERSGNIQFRDERRYLNGSVHGSYGYVRPDGRVTITHFISDAASGYRSQTQTFEETASAAQWPSKPPLGLAMAQRQPTGNGSYYDQQQHLNLSTDAVAPQVALALQQQHGVQMQAIDVAAQLLAPPLQEILNGKIPLQQRPVKGEGNVVGFETVQNFLPADFAIAPFELPPQQKEEQLIVKTPNSKYEKAKENNAEKTLQLDQTANTPAPLTSSVTADNTWYERQMNESHSDVLQRLPDLQRKPA